MDITILTILCCHHTWCERDWCKWVPAHCWRIQAGTLDQDESHLICNDKSKVCSIKQSFISSLTSYSRNCFIRDFLAKAEKPGAITVGQVEDAWAALTEAELEVCFVVIVSRRE